MLEKIDKDQERYASSYSLRVTNDLNERGIAFEAYLAGMRKQERIDSDELAAIIDKIIDISLYNLSANCRMADHIEYIKYRLEGGELDEEEWFLEQCHN